MAENSIKLKSINDILIEKCKFYIPPYQRGYRWTRRQVIDLLDDIWEFAEKERVKDEFYCLQPIVVKEKASCWEVIDGQQRLITIYLILSYINKNIIKVSNELFTLEFETRKDSQIFLQGIDKNKKNDNIDYFHICSALDYLEDWFSKNSNIALMVTKFYPVLLDNTKVIWYQVNDGSEAVEIFTRINIGKIPLTNAELIKALFLRSDNFGNNIEKVRLKQLEIASEWDRIEFSLQNDEFWYFLNRQDNNLVTRIEFIFDLMADKQIRDDEYFTFRHFNDEFKTKNIDKIWKEIKDYFMTFEEWFNNRELFHWIGYLIICGKKIQDIRNDSIDKTKTDFIVFLKEQIKKQVKYQIIDLDYEENDPNNAIEKILLLFNIETIINNNKENSRFPFNRYKNDKWSLEHIHAQNSEGLNNYESRKNWLLEVKNSLVTGLTP